MILELTGKHIVVLGAGGSGVAAARLAHRHGAVVTVLDERPGEALEAVRQRLSEESIALVAGWKASEAAVVPACDLCIVSPGVGLNSPMSRYYAAQGCRMESELEFGGRYCPWPKLSITGTNGKTTTVEMLKHCLAGAGKHVEAGGNIGLPLSEIALKEEPWDVLVVEVSSYQLEQTHAFASAGAALLNITPDHLSRHGTMEVYRDTKLRLLAQVEDSGICVVQAAVWKDPAVRAALAGKNVLRFSSCPEDAEADYTVQAGWLCRRTAGGTVRKLLDTAELPFGGNHNYENCLAVLALGEAVGMSPETLCPHMRSFRVGPHRMEVVWRDGNTAYVNDSKATNLDALVQSLAVFDKGRRDIALIAGGVTKGCDLAPLAERIAAGCCGVWLIGESRDELKSAWGKAVSCHTCATLEEAFEGASAAVREHGGTVLLSPGCASQDMFKDYVERGNRFVDLVAGLRRNERAFKKGDERK